jgi:hypothetical protein
MKNLLTILLFFISVSAMSQNKVVIQAGSGGGSTTIPPNAGSGFRVYQPQTPAFRSFACTNCTFDTATTGQLGLTIPTSTTSVLGLVKPDGSTITISAGVISASGGLSAIASGTALANNTTSSATPTATGVGIIVIPTTTISNQANLSINMSTYYNLYDYMEIVVYNYVPASSQQEVDLQVSVDGTTFDAGAGNYKWAYTYNTSASATPGGGVSASDTKIKILASVNTASPANFTITLWNPSNASTHPLIRCVATYSGNSNPDYISLQGGGERVTNQVTEGIRILAGSGNISLSYMLIGYKH